MSEMKFQEHPDWPVDAVPVAPLRALVEQWRAIADRKRETGYYARPEISGAFEECADDLAALLDLGSPRGEQ